MATLVWDPIIRPYSVGVDQGVLYLGSSAGVAWNGLVSVEEQQDDIIDTARYFDGRRYILSQSKEDFSVKIEAYTYPPEFDVYVGYVDQQTPQRFGMSYHTGDSTTGKIHLVYNALAESSDKNMETTSNVSEAELFSWNVTTRPFEYSGFAPTSHVVIDLSLIYPGALTALKNIIYGTVSTNPRLPTLSELKTLFDNNAYLRVTDNGDGTWTATWFGPPADDPITMLDSTTFQINWPSAIMIDTASYTLSNF